MACKSLPTRRIRSRSGTSPAQLLTVNTADGGSTRRHRDLRDVTIGSTIFVRAKIASAGKLAAEEIIVLPDGTAFGT